MYVPAPSRPYTPSNSTRPAFLPHKPTLPLPHPQKRKESLMPNRLGCESVVLLADKPVGLRFTRLISLIPRSFIRRWSIWFALHVASYVFLVSHSSPVTKKNKITAENQEFHLVLLPQEKSSPPFLLFEFLISEKDCYKYNLYNTSNADNDQEITYSPQWSWTFVEETPKAVIRDDLERLELHLFLDPKLYIISVRFVTRHFHPIIDLWSPIQTHNVLFHGNLGTYFTILCWCWGDSFVWTVRLNATYSNTPDLEGRSGATSAALRGHHMHVFAIGLPGQTHCFTPMYTCSSAGHLHLMLSNLTSGNFLRPMRCFISAGRKKPGSHRRTLLFSFFKAIWFWTDASAASTVCCICSSSCVCEPSCCALVFSSFVISQQTLTCLTAVSTFGTFFSLPGSAHRVPVSMLVSAFSVSQQQWVWRVSFLSWALVGSRGCSMVAECPEGSNVVLRANKDQKNPEGAGPASESKSLWWQILK